MDTRVKPAYDERRTGCVMSNKTVKYTAGEIGRLRVIEDFLPAPADLVPREKNVKAVAQKLL